MRVKSYLYNSLLRPLSTTTSIVDLTTIPYHTLGQKLSMALSITAPKMPLYDVQCGFPIEGPSTTDSTTLPC